MALIGHLFAIAFGFLFAGMVAGLIVVGVILFPEISALDTGMIDANPINILLGFGYLFVSGLAVMPVLIVVVITEAFSVRSALAYGIGGAVIGLACYLALTPFDPATMQFNGIDRRHLEALTSAGIVGGLIYWLIAGRNAGKWRQSFQRPAPPLNPAP